MIKALFVFSISIFVNFAFAQENVAKAYFVLNPLGDFVAKMKVISGSAYLQDGKYKAKNIIVDLKTLATGMELRDEHAKNKYLDIKKFPQAILIDGVGANGVGKARIKVRDKENIVNGTYKIINSGKSLSAEFKIKLSSFGIEEINFKGIGVEDEVKVEVVVPVTSGNDSKTAAVPAKAASNITAPPAKATAAPSKVPPKK